MTLRNDYRRFGLRARVAKASAAGPSITEDFAGGAGTIIGKTTTTGSKVWTESGLGGNHWNLDGSGHGTPGGAGVMGAHIDTGLVVVDHTMTLVTKDTGSAHGFLLWYTDVNNWGVAMFNQFNNRAIIQKTVGGLLTSIDSQVITIANGDVFRVVGTLPSLALKQNGVTVASTSPGASTEFGDAAFVGKTNHGLYANSAGAGAGTIDNYSVT